MGGPQRGEPTGTTGETCAQIPVKQAPTPLRSFTGIWALAPRLACWVPGGQRAALPTTEGVGSPLSSAGRKLLGPSPALRIRSQRHLPVWCTWGTCQPAHDPTAGGAVQMAGVPMGALRPGFLHQGQASSSLLQAPRAPASPRRAVLRLPRMKGLREGTRRKWP